MTSLRRNSYLSKLYDIYVTSPFFKTLLLSMLLSQCYACRHDDVTVDHIFVESQSVILTPTDGDLHNSSI